MRGASLLLMASLVVLLLVPSSPADADPGTDWAAEIEGASPGSAVVVSGIWTLSEDVTVPAGITVVLACDEKGTGYVDGRNPDGSKGADRTEVARVVVPEGVVLTVKGTVLVNAETCWAEWNCDLGVTGGYSRVENRGTIVVCDGGTWDNFGETSGSGTLRAEDGSTVRDRFMVVHWRGGSTAQAQMSNGIFPFNEYSMRSISCPVLMDAGASLLGTVKLYIGDGFRFAEFPFVGDSNGLVRLSGGASLSKTCSGGRTVVSIDGGAVFSDSVLTYSGRSISTSDYVMPVDGDIDLVLRNGEYRVSESFKIMPGGTVSLKDSALIVDGSGFLAVYEKFEDLTSWGGTEYPVRDPAYLDLDRSTLSIQGVFSGRVFCDSYSDVSVDGRTRCYTLEATGIVGYGDTGSWSMLHCTVLVLGDPSAGLSRYFTDPGLSEEWGEDWSTLGTSQLLYAEAVSGGGYAPSDYGGIVKEPTKGITKILLIAVAAMVAVVTIAVVLLLRRRRKAKSAVR